MADAMIVDQPMTGMESGLEAGVVVCIKFSDDSDNANVNLKSEEIRIVNRGKSNALTSSAERNLANRCAKSNSRGAAPHRASGRNRAAAGTGTKRPVERMLGVD